MPANPQATTALVLVAFEGLPCHLQRLDFYLAKFHDAAVIRDTLVVFDAQSVL